MEGSLEFLVTPAIESLMIWVVDRPRLLFEGGHDVPPGGVAGEVDHHIDRAIFLSLVLDDMIIVFGA
jgi:hypothetical protein